METHIIIYRRLDTCTVDVFIMLNGIVNKSYNIVFAVCPRNQVVACDILMSMERALETMEWQHCGKEFKITTLSSV